MNTATATPETPDLQSALSTVQFPSRRRTGKVARLPRALRDRINAILDCGHPVRDPEKEFCPGCLGYAFPRY